MMRLFAPVQYFTLATYQIYIMNNTVACKLGSQIVVALGPTTTTAATHASMQESNQKQAW